MHSKSIPFVGVVVRHVIHFCPLFVLGRQPLVVDTIRQFPLLQFELLMIGHIEHRVAIFHVIVRVARKPIVHELVHKEMSI